MIIKLIESSSIRVMKEPNMIEFIIKTTEFIEELTEDIYLKDIGCVIKDTLYILSRCIINAYEVSYGYGDEITEGTIEGYANDCDTINLNFKFTDRIKRINAEDYIMVSDFYGRPDEMTYDEFCQKCLAVKI